MPFIEIPLGDAVAKSLAEEGTHLVRIKGHKIVKSKDPNKTDQMNTNILLEFPERPNTKTMFHTLPGIDSTEIGNEEAEDTVNNKLLMTRAFLDAFDIEYTEEGYNSEDLNGAEAECRIGIEEGDDGRMRNRLSIDW